MLHPSQRQASFHFPIQQAPWVGAERLPCDLELGGYACRLYRAGNTVRAVIWRETELASVTVWDSAQAAYRAARHQLRFCHRQHPIS